MANGYLGKISAIVSANTGDFKPKLDAAASDVQKFARTMERSLASASRDASRSFEGIYTPLQKIERALKAASDAKISFKGYSGQIRNIDDLQKRLAELGKRQIDISVSGTSFSSVAELRRAIEGVRSSHMEAVQRVGGLDKARDIVSYKAAEEGRGAYGPVVAVETTGLDEAVAKMSRLRSEKDVEVAIRVVDGNLLESATKQFRQLAQVAREIDTPLSAASASISGLSMELQAALHPALTRVQAADESLHTSIEKNAGISKRAYFQLRREVEEFRNAVSRAAEADSLTARIGKGNDLKSMAPSQYDLLKRAGDATASAAAFSGQELKSFGVVEQQRIVDAQARQVNALRAKRDTMQGDTTEIDAAIARREARLEKEIATYERLIGAVKRYRDAQPTPGNPTGPFGPEPPPGSKVINGKTRTPVDPNALYFGAASPYYPGQRPGNPTGPFGPEPTEEMRRARREAEALEASMEQLRAKSNFTVTGNVQSVKQAEAEISRLIGLMSQLDGKGRSAVRGLINNAINSLSSGDISKIQSAITAIESKMSSLGVRGLRTGDVSRMGVDRWSLAVQQAGFAVDDFFSVTGSFDQRLRAIGNNVSQLGFILGGTTGLFVTLGITVGTQVALMFGKYVLKLEDAKTKQERLKAMTDSLNSSFESQKTVVEALADSYADLAKEIRNASLPEKNLVAVGRKESLDDLRQKQAASRRETIASSMPEVADLRLKRAMLEKRLSEEASDLAAQAAIRLQIKDNRQQEDDIVSGVEAAAAGRVKAGDRMLTPAIQKIYADATIRDIEQRNLLIEAGAKTTPRDAAMSRDSRIAAELAVGMQQMKDAVAVAALAMAGPLSDAIKETSKRLQELDGWVDKTTQDDLTRAGFDLDALVKEAFAGNLSKEQVQARGARIGEAVSSVARDVPYFTALKQQREEVLRANEEMNREFEAAADRGKALAATPEQKAAEDLVQGLNDIRSRFGQIAEETTGLLDNDGLRRAQKEFAGNAATDLAPLFAQMRDEVMAARLQGPSRASLSASDITTTQGAAELNRLIRGDDSAKDVNLAEMQKQSRLLEAIERAIRDTTGVVVNF